MAYTDEGFNSFLERSIESNPGSTNLQSLPSTGRNLTLDQLQVSGSLGNTFQLGGAVDGGNIQNLHLSGDLVLDGQLVIGDKAFTFDGRKVQMTVNDGKNDQVLIGKAV